MLTESIFWIHIEEESFHSCNNEQTYIYKVQSVQPSFFKDLVIKPVLLQ